MSSDDRTQAQDRPFRMAQPSLPHPLLYVTCGHKGMRAGGVFRRGMPMRCPACAAASRQRAA